MIDIQKYILSLLEAECDARDLVLVTAHDYANIGTATAMRGAITVAYLSFTFHGASEVAILFEGEQIGPQWRSLEYRDWAGVANRHSFKLHETEWLEAMIDRWRELLDDNR